MGYEGCRGFVAFVLKLLTFVQTLIGVAMILYGVQMFNQWNSRVHSAPPVNYGSNLSVPRLEVPVLNPQSITGADRLPIRKPALDGFAEADGFDLKDVNLPAPWFIYIFIAIGVVVCVVTCIGHIAADITNGCCLRCYSVLVIFLLLLEAFLVGDIFFNQHWEKDIPNDPTGEFENIKKFIQNNVDVCKRAGLAIVIIQAFSLLLAVILRAMVSTRKPDYDSDEEYLLPRNGKNRSKSRDAWSQRMREKYAIMD